MARAALVLVLSALGVISPFAPLLAQGANERSKKGTSVVALKVGDRPPPLKASKWLQGEAVQKFEPGKVYVVEFWATWCAPCIYFMPHLAELQAQYKDKGVTIIAYSARDPDNTAEKVAAFVKKRGPKLQYTFAYGDDRTTYDAWMTAAGREGIPCTFVLDRAGRIAYIGSPMYLGVVLPRVLAGNQKARAVSAEVGKIEQQLNAVGAALFPDTRAGLKALKDFEAKYPALANNLYSIRIKLSLLPKVGEIGEAKKVAEAVVAKAIKQDNPSALRQVAALLRNGPGKGSKELLAVAVRAAEAAVQLAGDRDARALIDLAETYFAIGEKARAKEYARKAVAAAKDSAALRQDIERRARRFEGAKKEGKK